MNKLACSVKTKNTSKNKGPTLVRICEGCCFLVDTKAGFKCDHPKIGVMGHLGTSNRTPAYCPEWKETKPPRVIISKKIRFEVYERDGFNCLKCGSSENLTLDHVVPISKGGTNAKSNLQTLCKPCNLEKGEQTVSYRSKNIEAENEALRKKVNELKQTITKMKQLTKGDIVNELQKKRIESLRAKNKDLSEKNKKLRKDKSDLIIRLNKTNNE